MANELCSLQMHNIVYCQCIDYPVILRETLHGIVNSQKEQLPTMDTGVVRDELSRIDVNLPFAIMISGIRRCGKSTLLRQVMRSARSFAYFNFEDPRTAGMESETC